MERYVKQQMYDIGYLVAWRDKMNAVPKLEDTPNFERLEGISEQDLQRYLAYYEQVSRQELLKYWLSTSPEERYNERKKNWLYHEFNVYRLYGNAHSTPDKPGCTSDSCIIECRYFRAIGKITDEEIYEEFPTPDHIVVTSPRKPAFLVVVSQFGISSEVYALFLRFKRDTTRFVQTMVSARTLE